MRSVTLWVCDQGNAGLFSYERFKVCGESIRSIRTSLDHLWQLGIRPPHNRLRYVAVIDRVNLCYAFRLLPPRYLPLRLALYRGEPVQNSELGLIIQPGECSADRYTGYVVRSTSYSKVGYQAVGCQVLIQQSTR